MNDTQIHTQYSTGLSRHNIEQALMAAGKDLDHLQPADLGLLEDFHTMGRIATSQLVDLIEMTTDDDVLDAGSGIGGTARFVADECRCRVSAVDLTEEYCETARWLNRLVALDDRISVRRADVTELPFADATFQVVFSQHVQMNVADKSRLYQEARRVLADGGRLAMWDITSGGTRRPRLPAAMGRPTRTHSSGHVQPVARRRGVRGVRGRALERSHRPGGLDDADVPGTTAQPARTARLRSRLRRESPEPHPSAHRRTTPSYPSRRTRNHPLAAQRPGWRHAGGQHFYCCCSPHAAQRTIIVMPS